MLGEQKALFIGKITAINPDTYSVKPITIMMGSIDQSEIPIKKFDKYYGTNNKPTNGDFIVAVLLDDSTIDDLWVFKCTSDDYKTLKLVSERYNMVVRYEEYINQGKYFEAQTKIDEKKNVPTSANINSESEEVKNENMHPYVAIRELIPLLTIVGLGIVVLLGNRIRRKYGRNTSL